MSRQQWSCSVTACECLRCEQERFKRWSLQHQAFPVYSRIFCCFRSCLLILWMPCPEFWLRVVPARGFDSADDPWSWRRWHRLWCVISWSCEVTDGRFNEASEWQPLARWQGQTDCGGVVSQRWQIWENSTGMFGRLVRAHEVNGTSSHSFYTHDFIQYRSPLPLILAWVLGDWITQIDWMTK